MSNDRTTEDAGNDPAGAHDARQHEAQRATQRAASEAARARRPDTEHGDLAPSEPSRVPDAVEVPASASLAQTLRTFGDRCGFPDYYGANLDALLDCLRDQPSLHVTLTGSETLRASDPEGFRQLVEVLRQARADSDDFHFAISR